MAQGQSAQRAPWDPQGKPPWDPKGAPPGIPRDTLKSLFFKNRFFKKISVMLHQWVFYRTYPYDNTIIDNDFSRMFLWYSSTPLMYRSGAIFMKIDYFPRKNHDFDNTYSFFFTNAHPIHAIFMILRQREAPLILRGSGMILTGIYEVFYGVYKRFSEFLKTREVGDPRCHGTFARHQWAS